MALKYRFNLKDIKLEDFKVYLVAMFKGILQIMTKIVYVKWWGIDYDGYDNTKTVQENLDTLEYKYDMAIAYKPLEMINFKES